MDSDEHIALSLQKEKNDVCESQSQLTEQN